MELFRVWEDGQELSSLERSMLVVATWGTGMDTESTRPIDDLNRQVLILHARLFGKDMELYAECAECCEPLVFVIDTSQIASAEDPATTPPLLIDDREVICRPPVAGDVLAASVASDPRRWLAERCIEPGDDAKEGHPALTDDDIETLENWLREHHLLLEISLAIACPDCGYEWEQLLDIDELVWRDIDLESRRLLEDVDRLARSYGWSEADILAMRPERRRRYVELVR
jgi:hypothetical protein